jgi:hypothetical protein
MFIISDSEITKNNFKKHIFHIIFLDLNIIIANFAGDK